MPEPLPAEFMTPRAATGTGVLTVSATWDVPNGAIRGVSGVPVPARGSIAYGHAVSFGFLLPFGWDARGRKARASPAVRGVEDADSRRA
jgi:hypothetical protein